MFTITSKQRIAWPAFSLAVGTNVLRSRAAVPAELWPKLDRFRTLGLLTYDDGIDEPASLASLTDIDLHAMNRSELTNLARASNITFTGTDKTQLLALLSAKRLEATP